jgi:hypothetical protein
MRGVRASVLGGSIGALVAALAGCTDSSGPLGTGSHVTVDVDASSPPVPASDDAGPTDSPFAPLDSQYGVFPDGYAPLATCGQCACEAGTYCYGGSATMTLSVCDQTASSGLGVGCHIIPAGCANEPDCVCLLQALATPKSCYPVCADNGAGGFTVYCPP